MCMYVPFQHYHVHKWKDETPLMEVGVMWKGEPIGALDKAKGKGEFASSSRGQSWIEESPLLDSSENCCLFCLP